MIQFLAGMSSSRSDTVTQSVRTYVRSSHIFKLMNFECLLYNLSYPVMSVKVEKETIQS